jgi:hypothetical protein
MGKQVILLHSIPEARLADVLRDGLKAESGFQDFGLEMRRNVIYCWLCKEDDKMYASDKLADRVYVEITVDEDRCTIADMEVIGIAMAYANGWSGKPRNPEASRLFAEAYRATSVPISEYSVGMFWTPEVLVKGDIEPECIRVLDE